VGFGSIAREVAHRAAAFGMRVLAWSRSLTDEVAEAHEAERAESLRALLAQSDIVSLHCPGGKQTHHLIGADELGAMKQGALLVHTARGGVVDDAALREAVASGRIRAALDVFEGEPEGGDAPFESPLRELTGIYGTPHIGASTEQAESAVADEVVRIVRDYLETGVVHNVVNICPPRPARWTVVVR